MANSPELIADAPAQCGLCGAALCVRKQTINLALGNDELMKCLSCLAIELATEQATVLRNVRGYVHGRDCFRKEWLRYESLEHCPDPLGCIPSVCFEDV